MACDKKSEFNRQKLIGDWQLVKGFRNEKETGLLDGTTFSFSESGEMTTNLPIGVESPAPFEVEKDVIHQKGRHTVDYAIKSCSDSLLVLRLNMRGMDFELHLTKYMPQKDSLDL